MFAAHPAGAPRVKICGLTTEADTLDAIAAGADALGFNTWSGSKRFLDFEANAHWLARVPASVLRVALLVNASLESAQRVAQCSFVDALQLHGDEDAAYVRALSALTAKPIIKALRASSPAVLEEVPHFPVAAFLLDAHVPGQFGGTGAVVDLPLARAFRERYPELPLMLAGGLTPANVAEAIRAVRPAAVDVSSGVEAAPGIKSTEAVRAFITASRSA